MAATFSNPRLNSFAAERMNARLLFAENYVSETLVAENDGTVVGATVERGAVFTYSDYIYHDIVSTDGDFSAVVRFKATSLQSTVYLLLTGIATDGFYIGITSSGVAASHRKGATTPTPCNVDIDYSDGEWHTVAYVVDLTTGKHRLYVDALDPDEQDTTVTGAITAASGIYSGGSFTGEIDYSRVIDAALDADQVSAYMSFTPSDFSRFMKNTGAVYRCDDICNDIVGHKIWDKQYTLNDLYKGDRVDAATFPTFDGDKYLFDLVDDYVSNLMDLPTEYTTSATISTPQAPKPSVRQDNDTTFLDLITTAGKFWGYLHNLIIHDSALDSLQAKHSEYMQLYYLKRGNAAGLYHRLITDGNCKVALFLRNGYSNDALPGGAFLGAGTTQSDTGVTFSSAGDNLIIADRSDFRFKNGTAVFYGDFDSALHTIRYFCQKGGNYYLYASPVSLYFNGSYISYAIGSSNQQIGVTWKDGEKPRFYVDGDFVGEGSTTITADDTDTSPLYIGNNSGLTSALPYNLKQAYIGDEPLTDEEIYALFLQQRIIGATTMEVGNRNEKVFASVATAFSDTFDPGQAFQLIEARIDFDALPTTSEEFKVYTVRTSDGKEKYEGSVDPSLQSELSLPIRFDKRIPSGHTVKLTYTNTDANNIVVSAVYQTDDSVN